MIVVLARMLVIGPSGLIYELLAGVSTVVYTGTGESIEGFAALADGTWVITSKTCSDYTHQ